MWMRYSINSEVWLYSTLRGISDRRYYRSEKWTLRPPNILHFNKGEKVHLNQPRYCHVGLLAVLNTSISTCNYLSVSIFDI